MNSIADDMRQVVLMWVLVWCRGCHSHDDDVEDDNDHDGVMVVVVTKW